MLREEIRQAEPRGEQPLGVALAYAVFFVWKQCFQPENAGGLALE
jgi:hypothetical protein